jgi:hypothetical protein
MATIREIPDLPNVSWRDPDDHPMEDRTVRHSRFPMPLVALVSGVAILLAIIVGLAHAKKQNPPQPTAVQIQFTNVSITPAALADSVYLDAMLHNASSSDITGVQVNATFLGANGASLGTGNAAVQSVTDGTIIHKLNDRPIKPNESRPVRMYFEHNPGGWNHEVPDLTVTTVRGTTQ